MSDRHRDAADGRSEVGRPVDAADGRDGTDRPVDRASGRGGADHVDRGRALGAGVAAFVAVHLLALLAVEGASLPALVGLEVVAVGLLFAGDAAATGLRPALSAGAGALAALAAVGLATGHLEVATWVVAAGPIVAVGGLLCAGRRYGRSATGGEPA